MTTEISVEINSENNNLIICDKCGKPGEEDYCPYQEDVNNEQVVCNCCTQCRQECRDDI